MNYVVLARKWRPMTFSDLVGQEHVAKTLGSAIAHNRVAHAFLFTGVRGVGKTTSARILAKALNCMSHDGPSVEPCLECAACREIATGRDVDVQEIDGASYNGVDEVRRLQESLPYRPSRDRFKVIIVDEVHMLSQAAWNAFLKTLEEPPPHVKFIFATTEAHKVPVTILSRVQRFDFKLIPAQKILERLRSVLLAEGIAAEDSALHVLARQAAGSMRDAMSLLEQVLAFDASQLSAETVAQVLGVPSREALFDLARAVVEGNASAALQRIATMANQGFEVVQVASDLLHVFRDAVVAQSTTDHDGLLDVPTEEYEPLKALAASSTDDVLRLHQALARGYDEVARGHQPRAALEMLLIRLCRRPPLIPVADLLDRLVRLERRLYTTQPSQKAQAAPRARQALPPASPEATRPSAGGGRAPRAEQPKSVPTPDASDDPDPGPEDSGKEVKRPLIPISQVQRAPVAEQPQAPPPSPAPKPTSGTPPASADLAPRSSASELARNARDAPFDDADETESAAAMRTWRHLLTRIADEKLVAFLSHTRAVEASPVRIRLQYDPHGVVGQTIQEPAAKALILKAAREQWSASPDLQFEERHDRRDMETISDEDKAVRREAEQRAKEAARQHPFVTEAVRVLGARLKTIQLPES